MAMAKSNIFTSAPATIASSLMLVCAALLWATPAAAKGDATKGRPIYVKWCSQCHGMEGKGDGPGSKFMEPRPRIFKENALYKFRTTAFDSIPTDADLFRTITEGIYGTAMPDFKKLTAEQRWHLVAYIKSLAEEFRDPEYVKEAKPFPELAKPPKRPEANEASVKKGEQIYQKNKCWQCHGQKGRGNGPSWKTLFYSPAWGKNPVLPANLALPETFRGGAKPFDIYRTITSGLAGTPMPEYRSSIKSPKDRWHLVNYLLSLQQAPLKSPGEQIIAKLVDELPDKSDDKSWAEAPTVRIRTFANVIQKPRLYWQSVVSLRVQALYTKKRIALRLRWYDRSHSTDGDVDATYKDRDTKIYHGTKHPDQLAIQWPTEVSTETRPYLLFGDKKRAVNLWWWRADKDRISEMNGKGSRSLSYQAPSSQQVTGKVSYEDGQYTMVVSRALTTEDEKTDVQFDSAEFVPVLFHVWDGFRGELGQRRALTAWYWVHLEAPVPSTAYIVPVVVFGATLGLLLLVVYVVRNRAEEATEDEQADEEA